MTADAAAVGPAPPQGTAVDRTLRVFSDVRAGEGGTVLLMTLNLFLLKWFEFKDGKLLFIRHPVLIAFSAGVPSAVGTGAPIFQAVATAEHGSGEFSIHGTHGMKYTFMRCTMQKKSGPRSPLRLLLIFRL